MATKQDKEVIERFVHAYNTEQHTAYAIVAWPDEQDRTGKAIDAIAVDAETTLAIEHTLLQPFSGERSDTAIFLQTIGTLDKAPHLMLPNLSVTVSINVGAITKGVDWSAVAPAIERWYFDVREHLPSGSSRHTVPNLPFALEVNVERTLLNHDRGFFFVSRVMPNRPLKETVERALQTKVEKLSAATADKRILLFEKNIPIFGDGEVGELVEQLLPAFPMLAHVDEIWIANTVALESAGYFAIDLTWPLDAARARDYACDDAE